MSFAITGTVLTIGATAYGANRASAAGRDQVGAARDATAETARQYDQTRADLAPYRTTGTGALNALGRLFGLPTTTAEQFQDQQDILVGDASLPPGTTTKHIKNGWYDVLYNGERIGTLRPGGANGRFINDTGFDIDAARRSQHAQSQTSQMPSGPDMSGFFTSPGYQFRRDEGQRGIEGNFAARGGAQSGNALRALAEFNQNFATGEFGNYVNQLGTIAGIGQSSTNQTAAYGAQAAGQAGRNALLAGDARASGIQDQANVIGQGLGQLGGLAGYFGQRRQTIGYGEPSYYGGSGINPYTGRPVG